MRRKAATAVAGAFFFLLLSSAPLLAKPTRTMARPTSRRDAAPASLRSARGRAAEKPAHGARTTAHASAHTEKRGVHDSKAARVADHAAKVAPTRVRGSKHERTLQAQEEVAARSAVAAADSAKGRHAASAKEPTRERSVAIDESAAPASAEVSSNESSVLVNVGGVLRPLPPGQHLKSVEEEAITPVLLPPLRVASLYDERGHLIVPEPLYGSREVLLHQNEMADHDGLSRVRDDAELADLRREKQLVPIPESDALTVDYRLPENRRYSRPWTAAFLEVLAHDYFLAFHSPLQVDSAVRTVAVQQHLVRTNGNAAPTTGDTASPHLTGQAVDIAKGGLSLTQIAWLRTYLQPLIDAGKIDVEEEFRQACFHISVYKSFLPATASRVAIAASRQLSADPLPGGSNP